MEISGIWELELMNIKIWFTHVSVPVRGLLSEGRGGETLPLLKNMIELVNFLN